MVARLRAVGVGRPGDEVHQAGERVLDVAAEHVEVGDHRLRVDVVGLLGRGGARLGEVDALRALHDLGHRQAAGGLDVGGVGVEQLLVLPDGAVDVTGDERVLGRGVARVDRLLLALRRRRGARPGLVPSGDALGGELLADLVSAVRSSSIGRASCISGIGRPSTTATTSGIDGICMAWAICGAASMSTSPSR